MQTVAPSETSMLSMMKLRVVMFVLALFICGVAVSVASGRSGGREVQLGAGRASVFHWQVLVRRGAGGHGDRQPCIKILLREHVGSDGGESSESCGSFQPQPNGQALVDELSEPNVAVVAMAFGPAVASVRLFVSGQQRRYKLIPLTRAKATTAGLAQFGYLTHAFVGPFCLERFVTYAGSGKVLDPGERMPCH